MIQDPEKDIQKLKLSRQVFLISFLSMLACIGGMYLVNGILDSELFMSYFMINIGVTSISVIMMKIYLVKIRYQRAVSWTKNLFQRFKD